MKKILISLAIIGVVAGITLGITGAWWSDQAVSSNASFTSGNVDLKLANSYSNAALQDAVNETWNVDKMAPGGPSYESTLYMKNVGSVNTDHMDFAVVNTPSNCQNPGSCWALDDHMRITKLEYGLYGQETKSLLKGGAGVDLSDYVAPTNCTVNVSGTTIKAAIAGAASGAVICVAPGNYSAAWEGASPLVVDKSVTIASTGGPSVTTVGVGFQIAANNVTIKGFKITPGAMPGSTAAVYLNNNLSGITVSYNEIDGLSMSSSRGIETVYNGSYPSAISFDHNKIHHLTTGIYTNPHSGASFVIQYNEIYNTVAGIGGLTGANVQFNKFHNNSEAVGADATYTLVTLSNNEFLAGDMVKNYGTVTVNAANNWWGDFNPSDQVSGGNIVYTPYAGGPFIGYINGVDSNANGYADLADFQAQGIKNVKPGLAASQWGQLGMAVQLDGPTTGNEYQGGKLGMDMTVTMQQGPAQ
jgi:predicted ribosomally synthesized peptide with SipW-like signal peptide